MNFNFISIFLSVIMGVMTQTLNAQDNCKSYRAEEVVYYSSDSTLHFGATLTVPEGKKNYPAVIIVSGTGKQDRDGTMRGFKMFATIADYLSSRGIAVLRSDDRSTGESNGVYETSTTADFADDVESAINYLKGRKDLSIGKIGLLGHSEGGAVIAITASRSADVSFLISMAGLATDGLSSLIRQNKDLVAASPMPEYNKPRFDEINELMFRTVYQYADSDSLGQKLNAVHEEWQQRDRMEFKKKHPEVEDRFWFPINMYTEQATGPWYRFFIRYEPEKYLSKVEVPVLALNGDKDLYVAADMNLDNLKKCLKHNNDVTTYILPGLDHLFLPDSSDKTATTEENKSMPEEVLSIVYNWIKRVATLD